MVERSNKENVGLGCIHRWWLPREPGRAGIGVVIDGDTAGPIRIAKWIGYQDNNVAEYVALMEALQWALHLNATRLHVYSDSQVVVKQMLGDYKCHSARLYSLKLDLPEVSARARLLNLPYSA